MDDTSRHEMMMELLRAMQDDYPAGQVFRVQCEDGRDAKRLQNNIRRVGKRRGLTIQTMSDRDFDDILMVRIMPVEMPHWDPRTYEEER